MGYGKQIRQHRIAREMTQAELGKAIGKYHKRISEFENEEVRPDAETFALLQRHFGHFEIEPPKPELPPLKKHLRRLRAHERKGERTTQSRLKAASYASSELKRIVTSLSPGDKQMLDLYACDSRWEAAIMALLRIVVKVKFVGVRPLVEGFFDHVVLHPIDELPAGHIRFPAFAIVWKGRRIILIPQVMVKAAGMPFTMDFLVGVRWKGESRWLDLEADGEGHDSSGDGFRREALRMRTLRYRPEDICASGFIEKMMNDIVEASGMAMQATTTGTGLKLVTASSVALQHRGNLHKAS